MRRNNDGGFVVVLLLCIFALLLFNDRNSNRRKSESIVVASKTLAEKQSDSHNIRVSYRIHLDYAYTGANTYFQYDGVKDFKMPERIFSQYGPAVLSETMLNFQRMNGENWNLFVRLQNEWGDLQKDSIAVARYQDRVFFMEVYVLEISKDDLVILVAPDKKELDSMIRAYNPIV
jgi:hypothetical protein